MAYKDSMEAARSSIALRREQLDQKLDQHLQAAGWTRSCDYPGSYWLWEKTFPPSEIQKRREKDGSFRPWPGKHVAGVSRDMAVTMEAAWQQQYDDSREFSPTAEEIEALENDG